MFFAFKRLTQWIHQAVIFHRSLLAFFFIFHPALDYVASTEVTRITASWKDSFIIGGTEMFCVNRSSVSIQYKFILFCSSLVGLKGFGVPVRQHARSGLILS